jgi:hypothetical protein
VIELTVRAKGDTQLRMAYKDPEKKRAANAAAQARYRAAHPEKVKAYNKQYALEHPEVAKRARVKYRATEVGKATACRSSRAFYVRHEKELSKRAAVYYFQHTEEFKDRYLDWSFGISLDDFKEMFVEQGGLCAICDDQEDARDPRMGAMRQLAVDHDHETGRLRGLLCIRCNIALGRVERGLPTPKHFTSTPGRLGRAVAYLRKYDT